jgi:HD-GYP domain-containing protein (c-di-GMP phosphodiesterase class II)
MRLAELLGRLSLAFDIANDFQHGKAVRSVVLAVELGALAGASDEELHDTFWVVLLAGLGCTGFAHDEGLVGAGDDRSVRRAFATSDIDDPIGTVLGAIRGVAPTASLGRRVNALVRLFGDRTLMTRFAHAMCETSIRLAAITGAGPRILAALNALCERWDGRGLPARLEGEALALPIRLQHIGHVAEVVHHRGGRAAAVAVVRRRAGRHFDPTLAAVFIKEQKALFTAIEDPLIFDRFLALERQPVAWADERAIENVARVLGIFADLKCPTFVGHSTGVAALAERAAGHLGLGVEEMRTLRCAAFLHDIGRVSVPNTIWNRPGPLAWEEWERVRMHSYYTERVLAPITTLGTIAEIAATAHERIDASGYFQHRGARSLPQLSRLLAAADVAFAMSEDRPHRPALDSTCVTRELLVEANKGRLDARSVDAVLASLGIGARVPPLPSLHGLSEREIQVLRLLAWGKTNKEIGKVLGISPRTVQIHVAHCYDKLGVSSRAGAAIWLVENDLVR